ncbi:MAG: hypothetical protein PHE73_01285 [Sulfurovaceae bacterium]|nr:hypothetical protein [Sulfurovaceae bacterium]
MPSSIFKSSEYQNIMQQHLHQMIELLFEKDIEFRIICNKNHIEFIPELPIHISQKFSDIIIFDISEYSFESASIENDTLIFEAGFGEENVGARVNIPLLAIVQIFISEDLPPIVMNFAEPQPKKEITQSSQVKNSMEALLSNPENQGLLKKRGKKI